MARLDKNIILPVSGGWRNQKFLVPARNSRHRTACFALYRALLTLALRVPLPKHLATAWGPTNPIKHHVRKAFRRNRADVSPRLVYPALKAGYNFLSLLQKAQTLSSPEHKSVLAFLGSRLEERTETLRQKELHPPNSKNPRKPDSAPSEKSVPLLVDVTPEPTPTNPKPSPVYKPAVRPRPLSTLPEGGRRRIPKFELAGDFPIVRLGRPMSAAFNRVLTQKIRKRQVRVTNALEWTEDTLYDCMEEDRWDKFLRDQYHEEFAPGSERQVKLREEMKLDKVPNSNEYYSYRHTLWQFGIRWTQEVLEREREHSYARATAMQKLILEERDLAEEEKQQRTAERRRKWEANMRQEHGKGWEKIANQINKEEKTKRREERLSREIPPIDSEFS